MLHEVCIRACKPEETKFLMFEAKNTGNNLRASLQRHKERLGELKQTKLKMSSFLEYIEPIEKVLKNIDFSHA